MFILNGVCITASDDVAQKKGETIKARADSLGIEWTIRPTVFQVSQIPTITRPAYFSLSALAPQLLSPHYLKMSYVFWNHNTKSPETHLLYRYDMYLFIMLLVSWGWFTWIFQFSCLWLLSLVSGSSLVISRYVNFTKILHLSRK